MNDAGPSNSPAPARRLGATDEQLSAELRKWTGATPALHPVGELLDRHWEAAFAYARLCTDGPRSAGMLTTAAFTRLFGESLRQNGPTSAWRPHLLVTVRRIAAEWAGDHRRDMLHPDLLAGTAQGERPAARLLPPQHRRLLSGAFQRLPQSARCLLWHVEVEAEPSASPAALLGLDEEGARVELGRARDRLREECLQLHRELAPDDVCRRYLRLLDVTYRRGGLDIDPDLRAHIEGCGHCAAAADQLDCFNHVLGVALAEAVLGWGGAQYAEGRLHAAGTVLDGGTPAGQAAATSARPALADPDAAPAPAGLAHEDFPDPVAVAREVFPDPAAPAFPDPVGLTGTIGESFTDPVGTAGARPRDGEHDAPRTPWPHDGFPPPPRVASRGQETFPPAPAPAAAPGGQDGFASSPSVEVRCEEAFPLGQEALPPGQVGFPPAPAVGPRGQEDLPPPPAVGPRGHAGFPPPPGLAVLGQDGSPPPPRAARRAVRRAAPRVAPRPQDDFTAAADAPRRAGDRTASGPHAVGPRTAARRSAQKAARRAARRRHLAVGILTVIGLVALPLVLCSIGTSGDGAPAGGEQSAEKSPDPGKSGGTEDPSWAGAGDGEKGALRGRLHNVSSDLCVGLDGGKAVKGAEAELTACSAASVQQWTYEADGLLRSGAAPDLCLDSRLGYSVRLAPCAGASQPDTRNVRHDFTLQGALVPRWDQDLALAPAATDGSGALVVKTRTQDEVQRWVIDTTKADLQMEAVKWDATQAPRPTPTPTPTPSRKPKPAPTPSATRTAPQPSPGSRGTTEPPCYRYGLSCEEDGGYG
ncbi:ricin-type beta-trefoil lectin domain protein [Streptomyces sp. NPDC058741]|uniref:ricin-type beta-trefoil lectin domain protein n=1 Tax=Streptomyces sp. NPDC058741 TaxID=3346620 RepID=UPI0036C56461